MLTEAITALVRHEAGCAECDAKLPDGECEERARLKATWRRIRQRQELREAEFEITYILTGGQFGIEPGYVVLGLGTASDA